MQSILALDPAAKTGWARSNGTHGLWTLPQADRVQALHDYILASHKAEPIERIAAEDASFGSPNRAIQALHNELRGIIRFVCSQIGASLVLYTPPQIKCHATGNGRAKKPQMIAAARSLLKVDVSDDNIADALWILDMAVRNVLPSGQAKREFARRVKAAKGKQPRLF